ncbi:MAG: uroporphyrinogen-III synthase [Vicinamibacterales bacterium]
MTRDEGADGALSSALASAGLLPCPCPLLTEAPPADPTPLARAAARLGAYDWIVVASARSVAALRMAAGAWPRGVRTAAVGAATARALVDAGAAPPPVVGDGGAEPLWRVLANAAAWPGLDVLVPTTPGGRPFLAEALRGAGARVDLVEAYRMVPRAPEAIRADWRQAAPDAAVVASPRAAAALVHAVGREPLTALRAVVAIGSTTAEALSSLGVPCRVPSAADFPAVARLLQDLSRAEPVR